MNIRFERGKYVEITLNGGSKIEGKVAYDFLDEVRIYSMRGISGVNIPYPIKKSRISSWCYTDYRGDDSFKKWEKMYFGTTSEDDDGSAKLGPESNPKKDDDDDDDDDDYEIALKLELTLEDEEELSL